MTPPWETTTLSIHYDTRHEFPSPVRGGGARGGGLSLCYTPATTRIRRYRGGTWHGATPALGTTGRARIGNGAPAARRARRPHCRANHGIHFLRLGEVR